MPESSPETLRWSAYEHEHIEREGDWFWAVGIIAISAALTSILFNNILFALIIVLAAGTLVLIAQTPPSLHEFELSRRGIRVGETLYPFEKIIAFWVEIDQLDAHGRPLLLVDTVAFMAPNLVIPIEDVDPEEVRAFLSEYVPEVPMQEGLAHKILEFFGL